MTLIMAFVSVVLFLVIVGVGSFVTQYKWILIQELAYPLTVLMLVFGVMVQVYYGL